MCPTNLAIKNVRLLFWLLCYFTRFAIYVTDINKTILYKIYIQFWQRLTTEIISNHGTHYNKIQYIYTLQQIMLKYQQHVLVLV